MELRTNRQKICIKPSCSPVDSTRSGTAPKGASKIYGDIGDFVGCHNDWYALQNLVEVNDTKHPIMHGILPHNEKLSLLKCH